MSDQHGPWPPAAPWIHEGWKQLQAGDTSEVSAVKQVALWPLRKREAVFWDLIGQKAAGEADRETEMNPLLLWSHLYIQHFGGVCFHFWCSGDALFRGYASCQHWCDRWASCTSSDWPQSGAVTLQKQLGAAFWFKKYMYILRFLNSELSVGPWTRHRRISSCSQQLQFVELESEGGGVRSRLRDSLCPDRSQLIRWDRCVRGAWRSLSADFSCLWNFRGLNRAGGKPNSCVTSDPFKQTLIKVLAGSSMWLLKRQSIDRAAMGSRAAVFKTRRKRLAQLREMSTGPWTPPP